MKSEIRIKNKKRRKEMDRFEAEQKSRYAAEIFLTSDIYKNAAVIMLYMPLGNETDTSTIMEQIFRDGKTAVFPVTDLKSGDITPHRAESVTKFSEGAFSVREPKGGEPVDIGKIDAVIVPGIAFDKNGARVGFGKGCYDKFLSRLSAVKVGFCYEFQVCDKIDTDAHDISMDYVVTETGMINCNKRK